ncbi:MAG: hypothetical protein KJ927_19970 [Candidatus Eisenbacteria bacterium]|nr:hypothetical protein [Candidatus Eisenbacteria bacterium]MBU1951001.1 hypothetical protein [Candidatus Eisenbacteria bacterium]
MLQSEQNQLPLWDGPEENQYFPLPYRPSRALAAHPSRLRILRMVSYVLRYFPELHESVVRVGVTRGAAGRAVVGEPQIWLNPRNLSYQTIAHELIHVLQGREGVPNGERSCDLFSLARHHTLIDARPAYLKLPSRAFDLRHRPLPSVAPLMYATACEAVEKRCAGYRRYITWFENEIAKRV